MIWHLRFAVIFALILAALLCRTSPAAITWNFNYVTGGGIGFDDPVEGAARKAALEQAAAEYGALFGNAATIQMDVTSSDNPLDLTLASAATDFVSQGPGFGLIEVVRNKILSGGATDLNGATADGTVDVNWGQDWDLSPTAAGVDPAKFDFFSTIFHELNHAMGFLSVMGPGGDDAFGNFSPTPGEFALFDKFIEDVNGTPVIDTGTLILDQTVWDTHSVGGASPAAGLFFDGPNATAANGGNPVGLYTPNPFENGSSVSHLDDDNPALAGLLMLAAVDTGPAARTISAIERGIYVDLGYTFATAGGVIPEPSSAVVFGMLVVCSCCGASVRRRSLGC